MEQSELAPKRRVRRIERDENPVVGLWKSRASGNALLLFYCGPLILADFLKQVIHPHGPLTPGDKVVDFLAVAVGLIFSIGVAGVTWGAIRTKRRDIFRPGWIGAGIVAYAVGIILFFSA